MSSAANLVYKLPHKLRNDLRHRIFGKKKYQKNVKFRWIHSLVASFSRNYILAIAVKKYAKKDMKLFFPVQF